MAERTIHQIWMQGLERAPGYVRANARAIREMHRGWRFEFWDEPRIRRLAARDAGWRATYASFALLHQRVDFAKLLILYTHGGIVIDADAYTVRPLGPLFDELAGADLVVSEARRAPAPFGWVQGLLLCGRTGACLNNGSYIGKAGSHALAWLIGRFGALPACAPDADAMECVQQTTGPAVFDALVREYMRGAAPGTVVVLASDVLEPCLGGWCAVTERTCVVHEHEMTWFGPVAAALARVYLANPVLIGALAVALLCAAVVRLAHST